MTNVVVGIGASRKPSSPRSPRSGEHSRRKRRIHLRRLLISFATLLVCGYVRTLRGMYLRLHRHEDGGVAGAEDAATNDGRNGDRQPTLMVSPPNPAMRSRGQARPRDASSNNRTAPLRDGGAAGSGSRPIDNAGPGEGRREDTGAWNGTAVTVSRERGDVHAGGGGDGDDRWPHGDIVHVVHSRFMQHQANFSELALARLELFRSFCLPTMVQQSNPNFLWIVRADPELNRTVAAEMVKLLAPHPNFLLVASNRNDQGWDLGWRDIAFAGDVFLDPPHDVWSGDAALARRFWEAAQTRVVLETRLDVDDGLHRSCVEHLQRSARDAFLGRGYGGGDGRRAAQKPRWRYWCAHSNLEWHPTDAADVGGGGGDDDDSSAGVLSEKEEKPCVTPGLTIGYSAGVRTPRLRPGVPDPPPPRSGEIPFVQHHKLHETMRSCHGDLDTECLGAIVELKPWAVRSRTPTSAGMKGVEGDFRNVDRTSQHHQLLQEKLWNSLQVDMSVRRDDAIRTNRYIRDHIAQIVVENLRGQCTFGHSCKKKAREKLLDWIQSRTKGST